METTLWARNAQKRKALVVEINEPQKPTAKAAYEFAQQACQAYPGNELLAKQVESDYIEAAWQNETYIPGRREYAPGQLDENGQPKPGQLPRPVRGGW